MLTKILENLRISYHNSAKCENKNMGKNMFHMQVDKYAMFEHIMNKILIYYD